MIEQARAVGDRATARCAAVCLGDDAGGRTADAPMDARLRRSEQQRRVRQRSVRAEAVSPHRAGTESRSSRSDACLTRARVHADAGARRRARIRAAGARAGHAGGGAGARQASGIRLGLHRSTSCGATTSGSRRGPSAPRSGATPRVPRTRCPGPQRAEPPPFFAASNSWYLASAATLGRRTAELHLALADGRRPGVRAGAARTVARSQALADAMRAARRRRRSTCSNSRLRDAARGGRGRSAEAVLAARADAAGALRARSARSSDAGPAHPDSRRLPPRPGPAHRGRLRDPRLRGRAGALARRAARQAVAAEGRRRHVAIVQLRGLRGAVRLHRARARRLPDPGSLGRRHGSTGSRMRS